MIIEVIPFDISIDDNGLSYFVKDELRSQISIGSIVEIPFRNIILSGVVSKLDITSEEGDMKSIVSVICSTPIISEYQIDVIYTLSEKYFIHVHKVLAVFLPKFIYSSLEKKSFVDLSRTVSNKRPISDSEKILYYCSKTDVFKKISELTDEKKGTVIVFPDDFMLDEFLEKNNAIKSKSIIYKNGFSYSKKYKIFIEAYNKTKNIIIGTRKILAYNLEAYEKIVYVEDIFVKYLYSYTHKYKNLDILENIGDKGNFEINILGKIPSLELMYKAGKNEYKLVNT
ncbi:MAG: hypothetical protein PHS92_01245 [Candidatus Gracilibacteria bacterium]|nr:hypothetical protein [Candidatus Gracilibacteria bacterium]